MSPLVRLAKPGDLSGVLALYRELRPADPEFREADADTAFGRILEDKSLSLVVCELESRVVATCMLAVIQNLAQGARPFGVVEHVVTLAPFRRKGLGLLVLRHAMQVAWTAGCYKVMLLSGASRTEAHRLYQAVGFNGDVERGFVAKAPDAV
jgi:GNAT superfamily N-acetyltransferase